VREYIIFIAICTVVGLVPRILPEKWKPRLFRYLDTLFWALSLPALISFLAFALISYIGEIGNLTPKSRLFMLLLTAFASYYSGAVASSAGKLIIGSRYCPVHENAKMVCPECSKRNGESS
jgi:D-alanyl-lipoteichoic acid acyltransferase DltB (MBOAT superfamily)